MVSGFTFIGSPAMNFVTADLIRDDGTAVTFAGYKLDVPAETLEAKPGLSGLSRQAGHSRPPVEHAAVVQATEHGADADEAVTALAGGKSLWTARMSKESRVRHSSPAELSVDTRYLQFFDLSSGLSIGHPKATAALA
jgi:multiple sugar transport system ATP-binding protein